MSSGRCWSPAAALVAFVAAMLLALLACGLAVATSAAAQEAKVEGSQPYQPQPVLDTDAVVISRVDTVVLVPRVPSAENGELTSLSQPLARSRAGAWEDERHKKGNVPVFLGRMRRESITDSVKSAVLEKAKEAAESLLDPSQQPSSQGKKKPSSEGNGNKEAEGEEHTSSLAPSPAQVDDGSLHGHAHGTDLHTPFGGGAANWTHLVSRVRDPANRSYVIGVAMAMELALVFFGYQFIKIWLFLAGFFAAAATFFTFSPAIFNFDVCCGPGTEGTRVLISLGLGILLGVGALWIFKVGVFLVGACLGLVLTFGIKSLLVRFFVASIPVENFGLLYLGAAIIFGAFALWKEHVVVIISTAFVGSFLFCTGIGYYQHCHFLNVLAAVNEHFSTALQELNPCEDVLVVVWVVLALAGVLAQCRESGCACTRDADNAGTGGSGRQQTFLPHHDLMNPIVIVGHPSMRSKGRQKRGTGGVGRRGQRRHGSSSSGGGKKGHHNRHQRTRHSHRHQRTSGVTRRVPEYAAVDMSGADDGHEYVRMRSLERAREQKGGSTASLITSLFSGFKFRHNTTPRKAADGSSVVGSYAATSSDGGATGSGGRSLGHTNHRVSGREKRRKDRLLKAYGPHALMSSSENDFSD